MKYAVDMRSRAMMHIPNFMEIVLGIQKLMGGDTHTPRQHGDRISLHFKEIRLKTLS
jgi:hypothetical protein